MLFAPTRGPLSWVAIGLMALWGLATMASDPEAEQYMARTGRTSAGFTLRQQFAAAPILAGLSVLSFACGLTWLALACVHSWIEHPIADWADSHLKLGVLAFLTVAALTRGLTWLMHPELRD